MSETKLPVPTAESQLLVWLLDALKPMSRSKVKSLLQRGCVLVNGISITQHDHPLTLKDRITICRERPVASKHGLKQSGMAIVYEDDALIVVDKPSGLLSVATESDKTETAFLHLSGEMEARKIGRPFLVHRIDRGTSGLLIFARTESIRDTLKANWSKVEKTYLAVVEGTPRRAEGVVESYLVEGPDLRIRTYHVGHPDAKWAITQYRVLQTRGKFSLIEVKLGTGRKHQIRVHMASLGCPVVGDKDYGAKTNPVKRLGLHSWRLALDHPVSGKRLELESPLPIALKRIVDGVG